MDYGFHAPTVAFPVAGTLMVEPTESESLEEIDRFCDAMIAIRQEIMEVMNGEYPKDDNMLVNAPHTAKEVTADEWKHSYHGSRPPSRHHGLMEINSGHLLRGLIMPMAIGI